MLIKKYIECVARIRENLKHNNTIPGAHPRPNQLLYRKILKNYERVKFKTGDKEKIKLTQLNPSRTTCSMLNQGG